MSWQTTELEPAVYCEIQKDLLSGNRLNHHCVYSPGKSLNVKDVHLNASLAPQVLTLSL